MPGASNSVAIDLIVTHIRRQLDARTLRFRNKLSQHASLPSTPGEVHGGELREPENVVLLEQTSQLRVRIRCV